MLMRNPEYPLDDLDVDQDVDFDIAASRRTATIESMPAAPAPDASVRDVSDENLSDLHPLREQIILCLLFAAAIALRSWFVS
ncbi:hypothetical protein [Novipirellula sp.]|uniref:hypothetical protein n=1 Tax=Novipirellula sp. TaxID=2795430 RepID=UPI0035653A49